MTRTIITYIVSSHISRVVAWVRILIDYNSRTRFDIILPAPPRVRGKDVTCFVFLFSFPFDKLVLSSNVVVFWC